MALTAEEFIAHIHRISELSGDNEEVMNLLNDIQQDRTEPQFTEVDVFDKDGKRFSEKYGDLRKQYRERFFSSIPEVKEDQKRDLEKDSENLTFEALFKQRDIH